MAFIKNFFVFFLLALFGLCSCRSPEPKEKTVLVSLPPYRYFVERIAQGSVQVETLVPQGVNPHHYEPPPRQIASLDSAVIWFRIEEPFEEKLLEVFEGQNKKIAIIDLLNGLPLMGSGEEKYCRDRHVWLSPKLAIEQAKKIALCLKKIFPEKSSLFDEGLKAFLDDLTAADLAIHQLLSSMKESVVLISHPALGYFCKEYSLKQISIEFEGKDPLPQQITAILQNVEREKIQAILTEPQHNNKGVELIAERLQLATHAIDPYSSNYLDNLMDIAQTIAHD